MEFDPHAGDIGRFSHNCYPAGGDIIYLTADHAQDNIYIVYHEVQYNADFGSSRVKLCKAMHFDEERVQRHGLYGKKGGIEAFDMPNLQFDVRFMDQLHQFSCLCHRIGQRFLDEYVFAFTDSIFAEGKMCRSRGYDIDDIADI